MSLYTMKTAHKIASSDGEYDSTKPSIKNFMSLIKMKEARATKAGVFFAYEGMRAWI